MHVEHPPEGGRLGVAQLRELRSDVRHRAVVLAQLRTGADVLSRRCITLRAQRHGEQMRSRDRIGRGDHCSSVPTNQVVSLLCFKDKTS